VVDDSPTWAKVGGARTAIYSWSLTLVMGSIFIASWLAQFIGGWASFNETRLEQLQDPLTWGAYVGNPDFWARTLQNWQSEFLTVGSVAVLAIYLTQRGSAERASRSANRAIQPVTKGRDTQQHDQRSRKELPCASSVTWMSC
jgi:hypothetical protein